VDPEPPLVLFDGVCNLCNSAVNFVIDRDPRAVFRFASLQSQAGRTAIRAHGGEPAQGDPDTILLVENGRLFDRSTAALRIARRLAGAWKLLYALVVVPRPLRDLVYKWIARNRYRWFGKAEVCRVPTAALRARFVDE
jgi:predicted DCC family thiol-disulfide oxidoreductase YuxK